MAGWISSKLKVAETLLQQIDQQAAESLRKGELKQSDDGLNDVVSSPKPSSTPPLRDQLKNTKKLPTSKPSNHNSSEIKSRSFGDNNGRKDSKQNVTVKDSDWTELLNTPKQPPLNASKITRLKDGAIVKGNNRKVVPKIPRKVVDGGGESSEGAKSELGKSEKSNGIGLKGNWNDSLDSNKSVVKIDSIDEGERGVDVIEGDKIHGGSRFRDNGDVLEGSKSSSRSSSDNESDSDSSSSSDSRDEREREERRQRRRQILAAKAAAKAADAIKEQENVVARLEGEKQSLEKILEEQAYQAAQEASELQSMMMEMMEATELEKQKHNHTRMEVLARMAQLETANADLAKSLATAQWNLEIKVNHVAELRQQVDVKQVFLEELRRKIDGAHQSRETLTHTHLMASKGFALQKGMLEAECAFATDKISRLQEKEMKLEESINMTLKEMENPTEIEVELRRRLRQMTDHLIQKQAQVESLSSEKATLFFRIEAVSRLLDENKSLNDGGSTSGCSIENLESGTWESTGSKLRPMLKNKIQSGRQHLGSLVRQLDAIFSAGAVFLARNPAAKIWSLVYLVSLHLWVLYILFSHSQSNEDSTSSSVVSLENINASIGV